MGKTKQDLQALCKSQRVPFNQKETKADLVKKLLTVQMG